MEAAASRGHPGTRRWLAGALSLAGLGVGLLGSLAGCQLSGRSVEQVFYAEYRELSFDRPSDLIPPEGLRITSNEERQIALAWEPVLVGDVQGYAILRAREAAGRHVLVGQTRSRFASVYIDQGEGPERLGDGQTYSYRIHPFDSQGRVSRSHAHVSAQTEPRPEVPTGLRTYSNLPRKVALAWDANASRSVQGYAIYRSPTPAGDWTRVGYAAGRLNTVWEDPVNGDLRVMYYRIEALNRFNAASDPTTPAQAVTKAEPLPPVGLQVRRVGLGSVDLAWKPNVERDLDRYEIWRADSTRGTEATFGPERRIADVAASELGFTDPSVGCGQAVRYRLRAIDQDRLVSAFSEPLDGRGGDMGLRLATEPGGRAQVRWRPELTGTWPTARIAEARGALPDRILGTVTDASAYSLDTLDTGPHTLRVTLLGPDAPDGRRKEAPPCELDVELPPSASTASTP